MKRIKKESHYEKVEIIKIPYKPFRKKLYEIIRRFSRISLINVSIKSYVNFRSTGSQGNLLLALSKKSYQNKRGEDFKDFPYWVFRKKLWQSETDRVAH